MNVLITGGGGFIGSHLVESQLEQGNCVRVVDLRLDSLAHLEGHPNIEYVKGDIGDPHLANQAVNGMNIVYHLASAHLDVRLSKEEYQRVNVDASLNLLESALKAGVRRMVHCSSVGVIGHVKNPPADEETPCNPGNTYEQTKLAGERAVVQRARETGYPLVVIRPAWVYGPRCPRTQKLFRTIRKGRFITFGDGRTLRHPVYVSDVVRMFELCAKMDIPAGQIYIVAGERAVTINELVNTISGVLGVRPPSIHLPVLLGKGGGFILEIAFKFAGKQPPFSRRSLDFFLKDNSYSIEKARIEIGFSPKVDLHSGLMLTRS